jgi:hypothetical protein
LALSFSLLSRGRRKGREGKRRKEKGRKGKPPSLINVTIKKPQ